MRNKQIDGRIIGLLLVSFTAWTSLARETNLAFNCPVRVSVGKAAAADSVVDGNRGGGYWQSSWNPPCWVEIDLGDIHEVRAIHVFTYYDDPRYYRYYLEVSTDRRQWREVVNARENTTISTSEGIKHVFDPVQARFVRLTVTFCSTRQSGHICEIEVYDR